MIRLVYSNRTEELARALARDLEAAQDAPGGSVFEPFVLVVPNRNVETYAKLELARYHGVAANLEVHLLRRFLGLAASRATGNARLVEPETVLGLLLDRLIDPASLARPELADVRHYLTAAGDARDAVDLRRVALAAHVSRLFEEYGYARPDMLRAWETTPTLEGTRHAAAEIWQRALWLDLFGAGGLVAARAEAQGERWLSLADLFAEVSPAALDVPPRVHLFGISYVSRAFHTLFARLAEACELSIYTLNPCMEFWEDVGDDLRAQGGGRFPHRSAAGSGYALDDEDPFRLEAPGDPLALRLWGRPGRENVRLLNELASCDFEAAFVDPRAQGATLLAELQHEILVRAEPTRTPIDLPARRADESVKVLACPSVRREAEIVASEIWSLVRESGARADRGEGARIAFHEIAIIVPSTAYDAYHTHLDAALVEAFEIPHHVLDAPLARTSRVAEAVDLLLGLPFGTFTRKEVMRVLLHPAVMARFPALGEEGLRLLPARLGIVHGRDHGDHAETYIARDILNWDQGLRRLALGAFMTSSASGDPAPFVAGEERYLPVETASFEREAAALFGALATSLLADATYARDAELTIAEWASFFAALASSYVAASSETEERALFDCFGALAGLADVDIGGRKVSFRIASELARARLAGLTSGREGYLSGGVAIASFLPMRAIPFRAIFVMGLGEGLFPQGDPRDPLDLRLARRRAGDVRPREQDRYMFLEALLCARDRLSLSYVDRDALTGEALAPSSVVSDLLTMLARGYLGEDGVKAVTTRFPLRRHGEREMPTAYGAAGADRFGAPPEARREAVAAALGRDLAEHLGGVVPPLDDVRKGVRPEVRAALDARLGLAIVPPTGAGEGAPRPVVSLSIAALRAFLECPLQGYAKYRLRLEEEEEDDPLGLEDEVLETPRNARTMLLREVLLDARARGIDAAVAYDEKRASLALSGTAPTGLFADAEREEHLRILEDWRALIAQAIPAEAAAISPVRIGRAAEHVDAGTLRDAVSLDVVLTGADGTTHPTRVLLHGATQPVSADPSASWTFAATKPPPPGESVRTDKRSIAAFLDHVVLAASGEGTRPAHVAELCFADGSTPGRQVRTFRALDRESARAYLAALSTELLEGDHGYLLPCEAALTFVREGGARTVAEIVDELVDGYESQPDRERFSSALGPLDDIRPYAVPDEAIARAMIARRFMYFDKPAASAPYAEDDA